MPRAPGIPKTPYASRRFGVAGREIRPLSGPEIEIPANEDEDFLRRYTVWEAQTAGSLPEYITWEWLVFKKRLQPGLDFVYQDPIFGGRSEFGGFLLDFFFPSQSMGWRIQGERYHLREARSRALDIISKELLVGRGIEIIDLWESDLLTRPNFVLDLAWRGLAVQSKVPV